MKIKWKVQEAPTGPYKSFQSRGWPQAHYKDEHETPAALIQCVDDYVPSRVKKGDHGELKITVYKHNLSEVEQKRHGPWSTHVLARRAKTLDEAKQLVQKFLDQNPDWIPKHGT